MAAQVQQAGTPAANFTLLPGTVHFDRRIADFALILAALFTLDIITTHVILWLGGIELNPYMAGIVTAPLAHAGVKMATLLLIVTVSIIAETNVKGSTIGFYAVIIILYLLILVNNTIALVPHIAG
ncbi:MAG: hypothetical protein GX651_03720, partial [Methanomicrobiales archaeon]|nr:hypothetical protein [Methanomicrobiales archaeon]